MRSKKIFSSNFIGWVVLIAAIALIYFSYFFIYIPHQEELVKQRSFRILREYAGNMNEKFEYYRKHLDNYNSFYNLIYIRDHESSELASLIVKAIEADATLEGLLQGLEGSVITSKIIDTGNQNRYDIVFDTKEKKYYLEYFHYEPSELKNLVNNIISNTPKANLFVDDHFAINRFTGSVLEHFIPKIYFNRLTNENLISYLKLNKSLNKKHAYQNLIKFDEEDSILNISTIHKVPFSTLMQGLKFDNLLNNITLFDDSGIIYNTNLDVVNSITNPEALVDSINKQQGGMTITINSGGIENHVMIQPVDFGTKKFYLAGFISEQKYNSKTRSISGQLIIIIGGLLLLVLIGMPVLKIIFLGKRERLHTYDANAAILSFILGISILVLITASVLKHNVYDRIQLGKRLDTVSEVLKSNIDFNLDTIFQMYTTISDINTSVYDRDYVAGIAKIFFNPDSTKPGKKYYNLPENISKLNFPVNEIFLMDDEGKMAKAVTRTSFYGPITIDLSQRLYFRNIHDTMQSWPLRKRDPSLPDVRFYLESIKSYNTGYAEAAISFELQDSTKSAFGAPYLAITSHLPSFFDQQIPPDIEFLIINENGDVLFHSIQMKNLHENFLAESGNNIRLLDAISHRTTAKIKINYNEQPWLAKIQPIKGFPFYHVTLLNLQKIRNKNARILVYTSYFLLATFICIVIGFIILQNSGTLKGLDRQHKWTLHWLLFTPEKGEEYFLLLVIQFFLLLVQFLGLVLSAKPFSMFVYQLFFILISAYLAFLLLGSVNNRFKGLIASPVYVSVILLLIALILLIFTGITGGWLLLIPLLAVSIIAFVLLHKERKQTKTYLHKAYLKFNHFLEGKKVKIDEKVRVRKIFHLFLFIWFVAISAIPVLQYYDSVKRQEELLWLKMQREHMALQNLDLRKRYIGREDQNIYKYIQGEGIDNLSIKNHAGEPKSNTRNNLADEIYASLPDPLGNELSLSGLLNENNSDYEWYYVKEQNNTLYYSRAGTDGEIILEQPPPQKMNLFVWLAFFSIPIILIIFFIWLLHHYLSGAILNSGYLDWVMAKEPEWKKILEKKDKKRILLISYSGEYYYEKTLEYLRQKSNKPFSHDLLKVVYADDLTTMNFSTIKAEIQLADVVWLKNIELYLQDERKFCRLSPKIRELSRHIQGKLIIELPFDTDFVDELLKKKSESIENDEANGRFIHQMKNELNSFSHGFYRYVGSLEALPGEKEEEQKSIAERTNMDLQTDEEKIVSTKYGLKLRYNHIWNHLTKIEKLILYDLADDGLLNLKNHAVLNRLKLKGLIEIDPYPRLYSRSFQHYILNAVDPSETKAIEKEIGKEGNWRNTKYLLWILLIPLIGFVFIAQGTSIEKVIGILSGGIAVIAGIMRVFNSGAVKQS